MSGESTSPKIDSGRVDSIAERAKLWADAVTSTITAATVSSVLFGTIWIIVEAASLPGGLPRLDAASFTALASAIALVGAWSLCTVAFLAGGPGYVFNYRRGAFWRGKRERRTNFNPFTVENRVESSHAVMLFLSAIALLIAFRSFPSIAIRVALGMCSLTVLTNCIVAENTSLHDMFSVIKNRAGVSSYKNRFSVRSTFKKVSNVFGVAYASVFSFSLWGLFLIFATFLPNKNALLVLPLLLFLGTVTTYLSSVGELRGLFLGGVMFAFTVAAYVNGTALLTEPFRLLKLVDVKTHFLEPDSKNDRQTLQELTANCADVKRQKDRSYEVVVLQRIGADWTIRCNGDKNTVSFPSAFVSTTEDP